MDREDLHYKLRAKLAISKLQRLPKENQDEKVEKMKEHVQKMMVQQLQNQTQSKTSSNES